MQSVLTKARAMKLVAVGILVGVALSGAPLAGQESQASLAARLQKVEDRLAIEQLMTGDYPRALDSADWKTYASFFTQDGELLTGGTSIKGPAAIEAYFNRPRTPRVTAPADGAQAAPAAPAGPRATKHVVTNLTIQIDGNKATAQGYWQTVSTRNGATTIAGAGHYEDELRKENGKWKFSKRAIVNDPPRQPATQTAAAPANR